MQDILDADIVHLTNKILNDAIHSGASDLHIEPYEKYFRIRLRVDGILSEHSQLSLYLANRITTRIKVLSQLDISERRLPQDGRFRMSIQQHHHVDMRVSSCPTIHGEKIVLRILNSETLQLEINQLGFEPFQETIYLRHINKQEGMILVTGPTGSGKTVSLYSALKILNVTQLNVATVEDPVEINLPGVNQVNINSKYGLEFSTILRSLLRQDPDVIMVGEIRDLETAQIAIKAAQTGHLVLSTLHTNTAADVLSRMVSIGIPSYNVASSISLIISQRLCRVLCHNCKVKTLLSQSQLLELGLQYLQQQTINVFAAKGCEQCQDGYFGRTGIYEILEITPEIRQLIISNGNSLDIAKYSATQGNWDLRKAAVNKLISGITSLQEIAHYI